MGEKSGRALTEKHKDQSPRRYDVHGLLGVSVSGRNERVARVLEETLAPFKTENNVEEVSILFGSYPSDDWFPSGSTVGDRLLYNSELNQTTVFRSPIGISPKRDDVEYVITGDVRKAASSVTIHVSNLGKPVSRVRRGFRDMARRQWRRAMLTFVNDPLFTLEHLELQAARVRLAILEPLLYFRLPAKGCSLIHASALSSGGSGVLIAGSGHVGKTTLALQLAKRGFAYYGDDLTIIQKEGQILSYPEPIRLEKQHLLLFPELKEKAFAGVGRFGRLLLGNGSGEVHESLLNLLPRRSVTDIFDGAKTGEKCPLRDVVLIRKGLGNEFSVQEMDKDTLVRILGTELFWEFAAAPWRHSQYAYCSSCAKAEDFVVEEALHHSKILEVIKSGVRAAKAHVIQAPLNSNPLDLEQAVLKILK